MGAGSITVSNYKTKSGSFKQKDYDERYGGPFTFVLTPFIGSNDESFFHIRKNSNGYEVEGEGYICSTPESVARHRADAKEIIAEHPLWYYHLDIDGTILRKEKAK